MKRGVSEWAFKPVANVKEEGIKPDLGDNPEGEARRSTQTITGMIAAGEAYVEPEERKSTMKKLMFGFAMAAAFAAVADIESTNVVGFNNATSGAANNFLAMPFADVGFNTSDIQGLKISDGGLQTIGWGTEIFSIWEGAPTVVDGSEFLYTDPSMDPTGKATDYYWGDGDGVRAEFSIAAGQGVVVNCAEGLTVGTAGEVKDTELTFTTIQGNNFSGNPYAAPVELQDFLISDGGQQTIGWGTEIFSIWEGAPTVVDGSEFLYTDPSMDPTGTATDYYWGDGDGVKPESFAVGIGQAVVINCAEGLKITIKKPYTLGE